MNKLFILLPLLLMTVACQPPQNSARDTIAAAKGYLDSARSHHPECNTTSPNGTHACQIIGKGTQAKDVAIDALEIYCSNTSTTGVNFQDGGPCVADKAYEPKLKAALASLNQIISDVKGLN